jgi:hypothetical protein
MKIAPVVAENNHRSILYAKFGEIFENKITNNLRVMPTEPPKLVTSITLSKCTFRSNPQVQTTFIFNDLSIPNFILGEFGGLEKPVGQFRPNVQYYFK